MDRIQELIRLKAAREGDCPASPICTRLGTVQDECLKNGNTLSRITDVCLSSIIILLGTQAGLVLEPATPRKRIQGFQATETPTPDSEQEGK